jgi:UDP-2,3-diacylglucosamine pyrophosphatase LpxH
MENPVSEKFPLIVVISDLHVGAGILDDFDADIERKFIAFLNNLSKGSRQIELVINGDFLDFVQADPWKSMELRASSAEDQFLCFTEQQSLEKLDSILNYHPDVFNTLGRFLAENSRNKICILPGNHDPDLFWQGVRARLREVIGTAAAIPVGDRLKFHLGRDLPAVFSAFCVD